MEIKIIIIFLITLVILACIFFFFSLILTNKREEVLNAEKNAEKDEYQRIIDGVIAADSSKELHQVLIQLKEFEWTSKTREMFLMGLIQGALMQFKKDVAIDELRKIFYKA